MKEREMRGGALEREAHDIIFFYHARNRKEREREITLSFFFIISIFI